MRRGLPVNICMPTGGGGSGGGVTAEYNAGNSGTSLTINWNNGYSQKITLTGNCTLSFSNPVNGQNYYLRILQDATGTRQVIFPATFIFTNDKMPDIINAGATCGFEIALTYNGTSYVEIGRTAIDTNGVTNGYCMSLNGTTSYISVADSATWAFGSACSFSAWVKPTAFAAGQGIVEHFNSTTSYGFLFSIGFSATLTKLAFYVGTAGGSTTVEDDTILTAAVWTHVAATYDGTNARFYVNGALSSTKAISRVIPASGEALVIGASCNTVRNRFFGGSMDEVAIWSIKLAQSDITEIYNSARARDLTGHQTSSASLKLWHRMGDQTDTTTSLVDQSGNSNTGTGNNLTLAGSVF